MTRREIVFFSCCLVLMGAGWGATQPMTKLAVSTGYGPFGLLFWQTAIGAVLMAGVCRLRRIPLPLTPRALRLYVILALIGAVLPNSISYRAAVHLPAGIMSLLLSVIPMFAFVIALALGSEGFRWRRFTGLCFGLLGVVMIVAPAVEMGQAVPTGWALIYLLTALFYAFEGNFIAKWGTQGLDAFQVMLGASLAGLVMVTPLMFFTGQMIWPQMPLPLPQLALIGSCVIHAFVYTAYVWLAGRAGAVFTVQVSYLVTGFGLIWAWLILGEAYATTIWLALGAMFVGMYLVQPRPTLAETLPMGES
ncbi:MAG: DMT family transporter [Sulfitobacter sp.]